MENELFDKSAEMIELIAINNNQKLTWEEFYLEIRKHNKMSEKYPILIAISEANRNVWHLKQFAAMIDWIQLVFEQFMFICFFLILQLFFLYGVIAF